MSIFLTFIRNNRQPVAVLAVLTFCYLMVYLQRMGMTVIAPSIGAELTLDSAQMGHLGATFLYSYAVIQFFSGMLADQYGPRRVMAFFFGIASVGGIIFASASSMPFILLGRGLSGAGMAVVLSSAFVAMSRWFSRENYPLVCAFFFSCGGLGGLLATAPLSAMNIYFGWRGTYMAIGILCLCATLLILLIVRDYPAVAPAGAAVRAKKKPKTFAAISSNLKYLSGHKNFWLLLLGNASLPGFYYAFMALWAGPYLADVYNLDKMAAGGILTMGAMGFLVGNPLVTWFSEKVIRSHRYVLLLFCPVGLIPVILLVFFTDTLPLPALYFLVLCVGFSANAPNAIRYTATRILLGSHVVGTVSGIYGCSVFLTGAALQLFIGYTLKYCADIGLSVATAYSYAFSIFFVCVAIYLVVTWMLPETFPGKAKMPEADSLLADDNRS